MFYSSLTITDTENTEMASYKIVQQCDFLPFYLIKISNQSFHVKLRMNITGFSEVAEIPLV